MKTTPYDSHTENAIYLIIGRAVREHKLHKSWGMHRRNATREEMIEHINEMCNEHGLVPGEGGYLFTKS